MVPGETEDNESINRQFGGWSGAGTGRTRGLMDLKNHHLMRPGNNLTKEATFKTKQRYDHVGRPKLVSHLKPASSEAIFSTGMSGEILKNYIKTEKSSLQF